MRLVAIAAEKSGKVRAPPPCFFDYQRNLHARARNQVQPSLGNRVISNSANCIRKLMMRCKLVAAANPIIP